MTSFELIRAYVETLESGDAYCHKDGSAIKTRPFAIGRIARELNPRVMEAHAKSIMESWLEISTPKTANSIGVDFAKGESFPAITVISENEDGSVSIEHQNPLWLPAEDKKPD